jgi:hypothetical protein
MPTVEIAAEITATSLQIDSGTKKSIKPNAETTNPTIETTQKMIANVLDTLGERDGISHDFAAFQPPASEFGLA